MKPVVVVDASVVIKWFVFESPDEEDTDEALELLRSYPNHSGSKIPHQGRVLWQGAFA